MISERSEKVVVVYQSLNGSGLENAEYILLNLENLTHAEQIKVLEKMFKVGNESVSYPDTCHFGYLPPLGEDLGPINYIVTTIGTPMDMIIKGNR